MSVITDVKTNKTGDKCKIYIDGEYYGVIAVDAAYRFGVSTGREISAEELASMLSESDKETAAAYLFDYLTKYPTTEKKARRKLKEKGFSAEAVETAVNKALEYEYLDDRAFAERYTEKKILSCGALKIKSELKMHGVDNKIIDSVIEEYDAEELRECALRTARKWWNTRDVGDRSDRDKFIRHMQAKGYQWKIIEYCIDSIRKEERESEDDEY